MANLKVLVIYLSFNAKIVGSVKFAKKLNLRRFTLKKLN